MLDVLEKFRGYRYIPRMDKRAFLRQQYLAILASADPVCARWRSGFESFYDDMIDITPSSAGRRFLGCKDKETGFEPGNVEWHYHRSPGPVRALKPKKPKTKRRGRKAANKDPVASLHGEAERKEERRQMIADQYRRWEEKRRLAP
ncbi:hypothetical protein WGT02_28535 (plasmid) [Rhizobium sp. T1470]|uniref:hypothetical protein n=1 Tax=unclassified Rhizobium TaxID=2613769 RepID=UPI001AAF3687|nr:hypothetical protein [Rhizobium sp. T1473]MCA0805137.1 hypothetical protein [Rhizobium sp. T1473]